jgi:hypothetical protein
MDVVNNLVIIQILDQSTHKQRIEQKKTKVSFRMNFIHRLRIQINRNQFEITLNRFI